jgi:hypothetical protein
MLRDLPNGRGYWLLGGTHSCILDSAGTIVSLAQEFLSDALVDEVPGLKAAQESDASQADGVTTALRGAVFAAIAAATSKPYRRMGRGLRAAL